MSDEWEGRAGDERWNHGCGLRGVVFVVSSSSEVPGLRASRVMVTTAATAVVLRGRGLSRPPPPREISHKTTRGWTHERFETHLIRCTEPMASAVVPEVLAHLARALDTHGRAGGSAWRIERQ